MSNHEPAPRKPRWEGDYINDGPATDWLSDRRRHHGVERVVIARNSCTKPISGGDRVAVAISAVALTIALLLFLSLAFFSAWAAAAELADCMAVCVETFLSD